MYNGHKDVEVFKVILGVRNAQGILNLTGLRIQNIYTKEPTHILSSRRNFVESYWCMCAKRIATYVYTETE
jgi:hypothetical protein